MTRAFSRRSTAAVAIGLLLVVVFFFARLPLLRNDVDVHRHRRRLAQGLDGLVLLRLLLLAVAANSTLGHLVTSQTGRIRVNPAASQACGQPAGACARARLSAPRRHRG